MWQLNKIRYQFFDFKIDSIVTHFNYKQIITHIESLLIYEKQVKKITAIFIGITFSNAHLWRWRQQHKYVEWRIIGIIKKKLTIELN